MKSLYTLDYNSKIVIFTVMEELESERNKHSEKERIGKTSQIREIVFGAQDGLLVPLGVISSVAGAFSDNHIVIIAGISEALAGAFSMATGAFLSSQAESQVFQGEIKKEVAQIERNPKRERLELISLLEAEDLSNEDATLVVDKLMQSKKSFSITMIQKELGLEPNPPGSAVRDALLVGASYLINAVIPLLSYFFLPTKEALPISIGLTMITLFGLGLLKAKFAFLPYLRSGLQVMAIGTFSGLGGYFLGTLLPKLIGISH